MTKVLLSILKKQIKPIRLYDFFYECNLLSLIKQAEAELGQAQHNWKLDFAEAKVGAEFDNKIPHFVYMRSAHLAD